MAYVTKHSDNPCSLKENEQIPAKIWELLRRNEEFKLVVENLKRLDGVANGEAIGGPAWVEANELLKLTKQHHEFAGHALEWLVPQPIFRVRKVAFPSDLERGERHWVPPQTITEGRGTTPNLKDRARWRWNRVKPGQPQPGAEPMRRGPTIEWQTSAEPLLRLDDPIKAWMKYQQEHGPFTLLDSWEKSPILFKSVFSWLWRQRDSRIKEPVTGLRLDAPHEHETKFFKDWSLLSTVEKRAVTQEILARSLIFDELAQNYRVFAIPASVRSRTEARRIGNWLAEQLSRQSDGTLLPIRSPELYGTPLGWDVFLYAGKCDEKALLEAYRQTKPQIEAIERKGRWRKERLNYINYFRSIQNEIHAIFTAVNTPPVVA